MNIQTLLVYSFNSHLLNDGTYEAGIPIEAAPQAEANILKVGRAEQNAKYAGITLDGRILPIRINKLDGTAIGSIVSWFPAHDKNQYELRVKDTTDNSYWYVMAKVKSTPKLRHNYLEVLFDIEDPIWRSVVDGTQAWTVTASAQTQNVVVGGNQTAYPVITTRPRAARTGDYLFKKFILIWNPTDRAMVDVTLDVTGQTGKALNTATLVSNTGISNQVNQVGGYLSTDLSITIDTAVGGGLSTGAGLLYVPSTGEQIYYSSIIANVVNVYNSGGVTGRGWGGTTAAGIADDAVLSQGKILANGADVRLRLDGKEIYLWLTGMNGATTGIHTAEIPLSPRIELTLSGAIAGAGAVATIQVKNTAANKLALQKLKSVPHKFVAIKTGTDVEMFSFTSTDDKLYRITGCVREAKLPGMYAHVDGNTIRWIEHDLWMLYGNANATVPVVDSGREPMQNLTTSTNLAPAWTEFFDANYPNRPGTWKKTPPTSLNKVDAEHKSGTYTDNHAADTTIATEMGMRIRAWLVSNVWKAETAGMAWFFITPAGIVSVVPASGEKYRYGTTWPGTAALRKSLDGVSFVNAFNELTPTAAQTWQALTVLTGTLSLSGTYRGVEFRFSGNVSKLANDEAALEIAGVTLNLDSTLVPVITVGTEVNNNQVNETITNQNNSTAVSIDYPCSTDETITIDVENRRAYHSNGTEILGALTREGDWLTLEANATNVIRVDDVGVTNVDHTFTWKGRNL